MIKKKKGFGQELDLSRYENRWTQEECDSHQKRGKFLKFVFFDISKLDYFDEQLHNAAIRSTGSKDRGDEKIKHSYSVKGWRYDDFPPIIGTDGRIRDGRTRIRAALLRGEPFIPAALFVYEEDEKVNKFVSDLSEGLIGNDGLISRPTTFDDLSEAAVSAIKVGAVMHDKTFITELVVNEFEAERFIPENQIPDLVNEIYERVVRGEDAVIQEDRENILKYLKKCPDIPSNVCFPNEPCLPGVPKLELYSAPSNTNQGRLWGKIARNIPEETLIVFYTTCKIPSKIKSGYEDMIKYIDDRYEECFDIVNKTYDSNGLSLGAKPPKARPYKVLGVYPQLPFDETHISYRKANKIIRLEDY